MIPDEEADHLVSLQFVRGRRFYLCDPDGRMEPVNEETTNFQLFDAKLREHIGNFDNFDRRQRFTIKMVHAVYFRV